MSITVEEALKLNALKTARVTAGESGLNKLIKRVTVSECPEFDYVTKQNWKENILFQPGDFFITSFYSIKDDEDTILETIKLYDEKKSSGLCIIDLYLKKLPDEVNRFANEHGYPIIFIDSKVAYAEIISEIMGYIYSRREHDIFSGIIDTIISSNNPKEIRNMAYSINKNFKDINAVIYIVGDRQSIALNTYLDNVNNNHDNKAIMYKDGILIFLTSDNCRDITIERIRNELIILSKDDDFKIGISEVHNDISDLNKSIKESITANNFTNIFNKNILLYNELGIYRVLAMLEDSDEFIEFSRPIINALEDYDNHNSTELLKTAQTYIDNDGDFKKTAKEMFQHENTIRYRIAKIKNILNMSDKNIEFYEQLSIAIKAKKMGLI